MDERRTRMGPLSLHPLRSKSEDLLPGGSIQGPLEGANISVADCSADVFLGWIASDIAPVLQDYVQCLVEGLLASPWSPGSPRTLIEKVPGQAFRIAIVRIDESAISTLPL